MSLAFGYRRSDFAITAPQRVPLSGVSGAAPLGRQGQDERRQDAAALTAYPPLICAGLIRLHIQPEERIGIGATMAVERLPCAGGAQSNISQI